MRYIIYGSQGSGKTTQAKILADKLGIIFISAGEISRNIAAKNTDQGRMVKSLIDKGEPTPEDIIVPVIEKIFDTPQALKGFVLDGYPRFAQQVESLVGSLERRGWGIDKVFQIKLTEEEGIKRIMNRAKTEGRNDDTPESISKRLALYHQQTEPIVSYFRRLGKLVEIDGIGTIAEVSNLISKNL